MYSMIHLIQNRKYPLRFLLYLEWILLGIVAGSEIFGFWFSLAPRLPRMPLLNLCCLFIFGIIGLRLPLLNKLNKIIYTGLEFCLIIIASIIGGILFVPLIYVIIIIRNCLIFNGIEGLIISGFAVILALITQIHRVNFIRLVKPLAIKEQLGLLILVSVLILGISTIFIHMAINALIKEFQSREKLSIANEQLAVKNAQLREYSLKIEELATLQERNRIARDIHDSLGHTLTILNLHLEAALKLWKSDLSEATEFLAEAKLLGSNALKEVRQSVTALRIDPLQELSLQETLVSLIEEFQRSSGIVTSLEVDIKTSLNNETKIAVYRIIQEALTNIYKHAHATKVIIKIQAINNLDLMVIDNGRGFERNQNTSGFGLQSMRDRALAIGGSLEVETLPKAGCKIVAKFPIYLHYN